MITTKFVDAKIIGDNIPQEVYRRSDPSIQRGHPEYVMSRSELTEFAENPQKWVLGGGGDEEKEDTKSTLFGSYIDCLLLTPDKFDKTLARQPEKYKTIGMECPSCLTVTDSKSCSKCKCNRIQIEIEKPWNSSASECSKWNEDQRKAGKLVVPFSIQTEADHAISGFKRDAELMEFVQCSKRQVMVVAYYADQLTGLKIPVKILLDVVPDAKHPKFGKSLGDLKTARDASHRGWRKAVFEHGYDVQAALYMDVYKAAMPNEDRMDWRHLVIENTKPFVTGRRIMSGQFMEVGRSKYIAALQDYCACLKSGIWPSYDDFGSDRSGGWSFCEPDPYMVDGMFGMNLRAELITPAAPNPEKNHEHSQVDMLV